MINYKKIYKNKLKNNRIYNHNRYNYKLFKSNIKRWKFIMKKLYKKELKNKYNNINKKIYFQKHKIHNLLINICHYKNL